MRLRITGRQDAVNVPQPLDVIVIVVRCLVLPELALHDLKGVGILSTAHSFIRLGLRLLRCFAGFKVFLLVLLLLLEFLQLLLDELVVEPRVLVFRVQFQCGLVLFERLFPSLALLAEFLLPVAKPVKRVAEVVVSVLLDVRSGATSASLKCFAAALNCPSR